MATVSLNLLVRRLQQSAEAPRASGHADEELLDRFLSGDAAGFELLVWRYGPAVLGACRKVLSAEADIEDAFQRERRISCSMAPQNTGATSQT